MLLLSLDLGGGFSVDSICHLADCPRLTIQRTFDELFSNAPQFADALRIVLVNRLCEHNSQLISKLLFARQPANLAIGIDASEINGPVWSVSGRGTTGPLDRVAQIAERKYCRPQARPFRLGFPRKVPMFPICPPADFLTQPSSLQLQEAHRMRYRGLSER